MNAVRTLALGLLMAACTDATPPDRIATYSFAIDCGTGVCTDSAGSSLRLIFRWPREELPVRVWVQPNVGLTQAVEDAVAAWNESVLYGEFLAVMERDSVHADVTVIRLPGESFGTTLGDTPLECRGGASIQVALDTTIALPFRTAIAPRLGARPDQLEDCFHVVAMHVLGHAFGLLLESPTAGDVMYTRPTAGQLSMADVATFNLLYHTAPTVRIPPRP